MRAEFFWGASTSAHQVEGNNHNDWSEWEAANAERLAKEASRQEAWLHIWPEVEDQATNPDNYRSGQAADHYNQYPKDLELAAGLGLNAYRFSVEWSRIEPQPGIFDEAAIEHYRQMVREARKQGMEPFVTMWHFTLPLWLRDQGGWHGRHAAEYFERYARKLAESLPEVKYWIILNEPTIYVGLGYLRGDWPPEHKNAFLAYRALRQLASAHRRAYRAIKTVNHDAQAGSAHQQVYFDPRPADFINHLSVSLHDYLFNRWFINRIRKEQDFIGVNYYLHEFVNLIVSGNTAGPQSDLNWQLYPVGLEYCLAGLKRYNKPLIVTESGLADKNDTHRSWYITESLAAIERAQTGGADVRGYFYWSLIDNFEWDKGFWPRFGLIEVDYRTQKRRLRPSAKVYSSLIKQKRAQ